jgi:hypothetical protein
MGAMTKTIRACLVLAATAVAVMAAASPAGSRPFATGIMDIDAYDSGDPLAFQRTKDAGAKYVKLTLYWPRVAPGGVPGSAPAGPPANPTDPSDPAYDFAMYDRQVRAAVAASLIPIIDVTNTPEWARADCTDSENCNPRTSDWHNFATAVAKRYNGSFDPGDGAGTLPAVRYYQAWIEPNLNFFYKPTFRSGRPVAVDNYRTLLNAFYDAVKGVNGANTVLSAGLAPLRRPGTTIGPLDFMRRLLCMTGRKIPKPKRGCNAKAKLDVWTTHPYTTGGPTHSGPGADDVSLGDLPEMTKLLRAADKAGKIQNSSRRTPFWLTEFSWDSKPPDRGGLKSAIHARWLAEAFYRMYKAGVGMVIWFQLRDEARHSGRTDAELYQSGLYLRGGTIAGDRPKRALSAFRFPFVALSTNKGFTFWGRLPDSRPGAVKIQVKDGGGGFRTVKSTRGRGGGVFEGNVRGDFGKAAQVRAKSGQGTSLPFSLKYVKDFYQPPFGGNPQGKRAIPQPTPRRH